jgi:hypothetical protein
MNAIAHKHMNAGASKISGNMNAGASKGVLLSFLVLFL